LTRAKAGVRVRPRWGSCSAECWQGLRAGWIHCQCPAFCGSKSAGAPPTRARGSCLGRSQSAFPWLLAHLRCHAGLG
jgi:hypothetical protein